MRLFHFSVEGHDPVANGSGHRFLTSRVRHRGGPPVRNGDVARAAPVAVGDGIAFEGRRWSFAGETSRHFDDHIRKSVPGYADGHALIAEYSDFFVPTGGRIVEVGCSLGSLVRLLATRHAASGVHVLGVDCEPDMIRQAQETCAGLHNVELRTQDARQADYSDADLVVMYYVMQFLPLPARRPLIERICDAMCPGGALILFEKVRFENAELQDLSGQVYTSYKLANGFHPDEIIAKTQSLRGVLAPLTSAENKTLLTNSGFRAPETIYRYLAFEGVVATRTFGDVPEMRLDSRDGTQRPAL